MSVSVAFFEALELPAPAVLDAMIDILEEFGRSGSKAADLLTLGIRAVRVQARLHVKPRPLRFECSIELTAAHQPELFPVFHGDISVSPLREYGCEMWLQGSYDVPFGIAGKAIDATALHGAAVESLGKFLTWIADQAGQRVRDGGELEAVGDTLSESRR